MKELINIEDYTFTYAGCSKPAIRSINLKVNEGEVVIIAGPSGCGKSTLLRSIIGLIPHMYSGVRSGKIVVDGLNVAQTSITELAKKVGFVFQNPENQIFMFSVERDVAFGLENLRFPREEIRRRVDWSLNLLGIADLAKRAPHELSDGQKQRVALAGVIAMKPRILILDEPTSLLDPYTASGLIQFVGKLHNMLGMTVMVVEHRLDLLVGIASRIVVMDEGSIILDGKPKDVLVDERALIVGVGVPTVVRLQTLMKNLGSISLSVEEFAERMNMIIHDNL